MVGNPLVASAQISLSTLRGTVTDSGGAAVANATVTLNELQLRPELVNVLRGWRGAKMSVNGWLFGNLDTGSPTMWIRCGSVT